MTDSAKVISKFRQNPPSDSDLESDCIPSPSTSRSEPTPGFTQPHPSPHYANTDASAPPNLSRPDQKAIRSSPHAAEAQDGRIPLFPVMIGTTNVTETPFRALQEWLDDQFEHPILVCQALLESNAAIVGSRVMDYFVPGFCTVDDWDFCVDDDPKNVWGLMARLERCGVRWETKAQRILTMIEQSPSACETSFNATYFELVDSMRQSMSDEWSTYVKRTLVSILEKTKGHDYLHVRMKGISNPKVQGITEADMFPNDPRNPFANNSEVSGIVSKGTRTAKVHLTITSEGYWKHIISFDSSCVQGFINGEVAALLYPEQTSRKQFYTWTCQADVLLCVPRKYQVRYYQARQKYHARGFVQIPTPKRCVSFNTLGDQSGMIVRFVTDYTDPLGKYTPRFFGAPRPFQWGRVDDRLSSTATYHPCRVMFKRKPEDITTEQAIRYCLRRGVRLSVAGLNDVNKQAFEDLFTLEHREYLVELDSQYGTTWSGRALGLAIPIRSKGQRRTEALATENNPGDICQRFNTEHKSPLLNLPAELRNEVYEYVLQNDKEIIEDRFKEMGDHLQCSSDTLLATCRDIRREFRDLWTRAHQEQIHSNKCEVSEYVNILRDRHLSDIYTCFDPSRKGFQPKIAICGDMPGSWGMLPLCRVKQTIPILSIMFDSNPSIMDGLLRESYKIANVVLQNTHPTWRKLIVSRRVTDVQFHKAAVDAIGDVQPRLHLSLVAEARSRLPSLRALGLREIEGRCSLDLVVVRVARNG